MPYVRQKTWLPLAPPIRGLSLRESPYGMGQTDQGPLSPDEQAAYQAGITVAAGGTPPSTVDLSSQTNQALFNSGYNAGSSGGPATGTLGVLQSLGFPATVTAPVSGNAPAATTSLSSWLAANQGVVLIGGGLLFGIALLKGLSHR